MSIDEDIGTKREKIEKMLRSKHGVAVAIGPAEVSVFKIIKAYEAKNYDGTSSGWDANTPDGERECVEAKTTRNGVAVYKNYWNISTGIDVVMFMI